MTETEKLTMYIHNKAQIMLTDLSNRLHQGKLDFLLTDEYSNINIVKRNMTIGERQLPNGWTHLTYVKKFDCLEVLLTSEQRNYIFDKLRSLKLSMKDVLPSNISYINITDMFELNDTVMFSFTVESKNNMVHNPITYTIR